MDTKFSLLLDVSINDASLDKFGHKHYAEILYSLITNKTYKSPYNIGLLGKWGVGKSSIKDICRKKFEISNSNNKNIYCIDFNAWKYGSDGVKRALLKHIYVKLGGNYQNFLDEVSRQVKNESKIFKNNKEILKNIRQIINTPILIFLSISTIIFTIINIILAFIKAPSWIYGVTNTGISLISSIFIVLLKNIPFFQNINKIDLPKATSEEFEELLKDQIKKFKNPELVEDINDKLELQKLIKKHNLDIKEKIKIVIFIDDLDRLPSKEMVEGINAIRAFMDLDLPEGIVDIVFVISCCENKIAEALGTINFNKEENSSTNNFGNIDKEIEAKRFLDKIFQFRIDIPPFPYQDMIQYAKHLFETQMQNYFPEFEKELKGKGVSLENLLCRLIYPKVQSPRQVIQIINAFLQSWWIAKEREGALENQIGGLAAGAVTNHPLTLAILSVLKVDFPYFYQFLQQEPNLLRFLLDIIKKNKSDIFIEKKLKEEFTEVMNEKKPDDLKISSKYYELELFLKGIGLGVKFPKSLKSLLLLNQDPVTRHYGDSANDIQDALSFLNSKDRIITLLGLSKEQKLTNEQAFLLRSVSAEIKYETYRTNAYYNIIDLMEFIDEKTNFLLDDIVNFIIESNEFREELKLENYEKILFAVNEFKQDDVIRIIKKEYLSPQNFSIPPDEEDEKEQNEAYENFKKSAKILLNFYSNNRTREDKEFFSWIVKPYIGDFSEGAPDEPEKQFLGFEFTDSCINEYKFLLDYIGKEYSDSLVKELEKSISEEDEIEIDVDTSLCNVKEYLNIILEKNDPNLKELMGKYVSSKSARLFEFGFNYLKENFEKLDNESKDYCLHYLSTAVLNEINNNDLYKGGINSEYVNYIVETLVNNFKIIYEYNVENIEKFCKLFATSDTYIDKSIELLEFLDNKSMDTNEIKDYFIELVYENVADVPYLNKLRIYLAQNYGKLSQSQRHQIVQNLEQQIIIKTSSLPDSNIKLFTDFIRHIPEDILKSELTNLNESLEYLFDKIYGHLSGFIIPNAQTGYAPYLIQILPIIKNYFKYTNNQKLSSTLSMACISAYFYPSVFEEMRAIWKDLNQELWVGNNKAQTIFDYTVQSDNDLNHLIYGAEFFDSVPILHTDDNFRKLFNQAYYLKDNNITEISNILCKYNTKSVYYPEDVADFAQVELNGETQKINALKKLWSHLIKFLNDDDILEASNFVITKYDINYFHIWSEAVRNYKSSSNLIIDTIKALLNDDLTLLLKLINERPQQLADLFPYGEERKTLALSFIEKIPNIEDDISAKTICSYAKLLYTDIIREVDLRKYRSDNRTKGILREIFPDDKKLKKLENEAEKLK